MPKKDKDKNIMKPADIYSTFRLPTSVKASKTNIFTTVKETIVVSSQIRSIPKRENLY